MSGRYFQGMIDGFSHNTQFGFISYCDESGRSQRIFFHNRNVRCDPIGRTSQCWIPGAPVGFKIKKAISRREVGREAADVHLIFEDPFVGNPADHREVSYVDRFLPGTRVSGFLRRESGEDLYFNQNNIMPDFKDRIEDLREGDPLFHGVRECRDGKFEATAVEIFSRNEIERLVQGLPAQEPEPEPDTVLAPATCSLPLIEIIKRRKSLRRSP